MSISSYMEKLLDGVEVEWKPLYQLVVDKFWIMPATPKFNEAETVPYITSKNIKGGHINFDKTKFISREDYIELCRNRPILVGDFLISMIGTIGEVAVVKESDLEFYGQNMYLVRLDGAVIISRYFWHFFDSPRMKRHFQAVKNNSGQGYLKANNIDSLEIPIPCPDNPEKSLAIQAEIVRILDAFTAMTAELTAELNMRKKQYNYYRDKLLSFEEGEVEWKTLEEVAHFSNGKGHEKDISEDGKFIVVNSKFISTDGLVAKYSDSQICPLFKDDILLVMSDLPNGKALSKTFIVDEDERYTLNQRIGGITVKDKSEILPKFLHYYLDRTPQLLKHDNGVDQTNLRKGQILEVKVPILPLQKQEHIVSILDKFDKLTKSVSEGLPREIELRQKQYGYYRDLLLSFPKSHSDEAA